MALNTSQLVLGKRVRTEAFTATVTEDGFDDNGDPRVQTYKGQGIQVRVQDDIARNSHFINLARLEVPVPYTDGGLYLSAGGQFVYYVANPDDSTKPGTWRLRLESGTRGTQIRSFAYPTRPLMQVTLGEATTE